MHNEVDSEQWWRCQEAGPLVISVFEAWHVVTEPFLDECLGYGAQAGVPATTGTPCEQPTAAALDIFDHSQHRFVL